VRPGNDLPPRRLKQMKRAMRREILARRDALSEAERATKSSAIAERVLALPELEDARTLMLFWSFGSEVDTAPMITGLVGQGRRLVLPRIERGEVVPVAYRPGDPVSEARFGAMEPTSGEVVDPMELDVVVTPGVAFDRGCKRSGYGGGFYDRLFDRARPDVAKIAVAFALQLVEAVPVGRHDRRVDIVATEDEVLRCADA
jgi:5-formyltetrahydrofolate cyclo-ligase